MKIISVAKVISYAIPVMPIEAGYPGWRVRFSFESSCGKTHSITVDHAWASSEFYFTEMRDIQCKDVEGGCDEEAVTTVELIHPNRSINDQRQGKRQIFHAIPNFGAGLGR